MALFGSRRDPLEPAMSAALERSGDPYFRDALKNVSRQQDGIREATSGEELRLIASGSRNKVLCVTNSQSLVIEDGLNVQRSLHREVHKVNAMNKASSGLVSIITEREQSETRGDWDEQYVTLGQYHPLAQRGVIGIKFVVNSPDVANHVRDAIQDQATALRWPLPSLFPGFYQSLLAQLRKPQTEQNVLALVEYLSQMFSVNALMWLDDESSNHQEWWEKFHNSRVPRERWPYLFEDMLAFFWHRNWRYRKAVAEYPTDGREKILDPSGPVRRYGDYLPFGIWSAG